MAALDIDQLPAAPRTLPSHSPELSSNNPDSDITLTIRHQSGTHTFTYPAAATISDLSAHISDTLSIPISNQKFLISPKPGLLKPPFSASTSPGNIPLSTLTGPKTKITLLGSTPAQVSSLNAAIASSQHALNRRPGEGGAAKPATPAPRRDWRTLSDSINYTFGRLEPLPYLPNPTRSLRFLERLRDDAGIKAAMAKHKFRVGLLTEMNPAEHTTHESRTLGLNRNAGEVIELRLRTDAYDGYRDYRTIRKTLCHELTHNVFGEHDARFWELCGIIEKEVERADWRSGGRSVGEEEFYNPNDGGVGDHVDSGAWTGGAHVLGGGGTGGGGGGRGGGGGGRGGGGGGGGGGNAAAQGTQDERRAAMARAAEERARRAREGGP